MKLASWNVNGLRAAGRGEFTKWFERETADVVCVQEIKCFPEQLGEDLLHPGGYQSFWHSAKKPGYSGVAIFTRTEPKDVRVGIGVPEVDDEGRVLSAEFENFVLINAYFPNSQRDHSRLGYKLSFCDRIMKFCEELKAKGKNVVICGDFNIAHREIDLKNPKANENNAGFLPEERAWMDQFVVSGYLDSFREFTKGPGHYTWWSYRPGVREKNIGWRLDYYFVNSEFRDRLAGVQHQSQTRGSDHCPVVLELR